MRAVFAMSFFVALCGCGVIYFSPDVNEVAGDDVDVTVVDATAVTVTQANLSPYQPTSLPDVFRQVAGTRGDVRGAGTLPEPVTVRQTRPLSAETRLPDFIDPGPYRIGVGDVLLISTPRGGTESEEISGSLINENARRGYTVQDDGAIAIPDVGRVNVSNMTLAEAEERVLEAFLSARIEPSFSLEIAEFNARRVSVGGAVAEPTIVPITLTPLFLQEALARAGGVTARDIEFTVIRIYRNGTLYQVPLDALYREENLQDIQLIDGDSVFVNSEFELEEARAFFEEQIRLLEVQQSARLAALSQLQTEISIRRAALEEARGTYQTQLELDAVERDFVYLTGEIGRQGRFTLPFGYVANLGDALFRDSLGFETQTGDPRRVYVLRGDPDPTKLRVTAYRFNATNAANFVLMTRFELRPDDVVFVAEQPVTRWSRVIDQITPALVTTGFNNANSIVD